MWFLQRNGICIHGGSNFPILLQPHTFLLCCFEGPLIPSINKLGGSIGCSRMKEAEEVVMRCVIGVTPPSHYGMHFRVLMLTCKEEIWTRVVKCSLSPYKSCMKINIRDISPVCPPPSRESPSGNIASRLRIFIPRYWLIPTPSFYS